MKSRNIFLILYLLGALLGAGWLFYANQQLPDLGQQDQSINKLLLKTQGDNAVVNEAVLRSRENLDVSYDYLTTQSQILQKDVDELLRLEATLPGAEARQIRNNFRDNIKTKLDNIERFKSHNSVLKNSLHYAPVLGSRLADIANEAEMPQLALLYSKAVNQIQKYAATGDIDDRKDFQKTITDLESSEKKLPDEYITQEEEFIQHTDTVLEELDQVSRLMNLIIINNQSDLNRMANIWQRWRINKEQEIELYNLYVNTYIGYLAIGLVILMLWLRNVYLSLDHKVIERTKELEIAYEELQNSQIQMVQSEKMALLGQMVAGMAHEVNTPLGYVKNNVTLIHDLIGEYDAVIDLALKLEPGHGDHFQAVKSIFRKASEIEKDGVRAEQEQLFEDTLFGIEQIAELVVNLKNFARLDEDKIKHIDVRDCVDSSLNIAKNHVKHFQIERRYKNKNIPLVDCSPAQINQVLLNLFNNAVQAMDEATGRLIIDAGIKENYVYIDVIDNGHGMDDETKAKIFTPFFTTKSAGEGTGLGLAICQQIMEAHGGKIQVDSRIGKGTVFRLLLPLTPVIMRSNKNN